MGGWCKPCLRRGTLNAAVGDMGLCNVHLWQWQASGFPDDYFERWWRGQENGQGKVYGRMPAVLATTFALRDCPECGNAILPWQRWETRRGHRKLRWVTPAEYQKRVTCSVDCGARAGQGGATGSGRWVGMGAIRRGQH